MRNKLLMLALVISSMVSAQLTTVLPTNEKVPTFTSDQIITFVGAGGVGAVVGGVVENATNSRFLGMVSGAIVGAGMGYAKDKWDMKNNTAIPNHFAPYNDTLAGAFGGAIGGTITIRINLGGRRNSKSGFNGRYFKRRR